MRQLLYRMSKGPSNARGYAPISSFIVVSISFELHVPFVSDHGALCKEELDGPHGKLKLVQKEGLHSP